MVLVICLIMASCESQNVKDAKKAFEEGKYDKVVECLENEEKLNDELTEDLYVAKAHVAYDNGKYVEAIDNTIKVEDGKDLEVYKMAKEEIVKNSIKKGKVKTLLKAIKADPDIASYAADEVMKACDELNYNGFVVLAKLRKNLPDGEIKDKLDNYYETNRLNKPRAFLLGKWKEIDDQGLDRVIEVTLSDDDMIGIIVQVNDSDAYKKNDVYWKEFKFIDDDRCTLNSISRGSDRDANDNTAVGEIDYKKGILHLHLTPSPGYTLTYYDTNWKRIK